MQKTVLKYKDETDRALGLAGMAVAIVVWDAEEQIAALNIDNELGKGVELTPDFHITGNPRLAATLSWRHQLKQLELSSAMLLGNVFCRSFVGGNFPLSSQMNATLRAVVHDEAVNICDLEEDEIEDLYSRVNDTCNRLFNHHTVHQLTTKLADSICKHRRLSRAEILDLLQPLVR